HIDHLIPFFDLESRHRRDGHDPGIVYNHVDPAVLFHSSLDQSLDIAALRHIRLETDGAAALRGNVLDEGVDPILPPRPERDFRAARREKARRAFAETAACARYHHYFPFDVYCHNSPSAKNRSLLHIVRLWSLFYPATSKIISSSTVAPSGR